MIDRNPYQTRRIIDEAALAELTASIRTSGVLQPILVRAVTKGDKGSGQGLVASGQNPTLSLRDKGGSSPSMASGQAGSPASGASEPGKTRYQLMAGERRWMAAQRAGLKVIPAVVKQAVTSRRWRSPSLRTCSVKT